MAVTYPHLDIGVLQNRVTNTVTTEAKPLHLPVAFLFTEKGPVGVPTAVDGGTLATIFGDGTLSNTQPFFNHATIAAMMAMNTNRVVLIRVADDAAEASNLVLETTLTPGSIPQYQRDSTGALSLDTNGSPIPLTDASGKAVSEPGFTIAYDVRGLKASEAYDGIAPTQTGSASAPTSYTFPILGFENTSVGSGGNFTGFALWKNAGVDTSLQARVSSLLYSFQPVQRSSSTATSTTAIADKYTATSNDVSFKAVAIDPSTQQDVSLNGIVANNYTTTGANSLPYEIHVYSASFTAIGTLLQGVAPTEFPTTQDPFLIDIIGAEDANGNPYKHLVLNTADSDFFTSSNIFLLQGGADGDTSLSTYESLVTNYVTGSDNVEFQDQFRFPISHFYDTGFSLTAKYSLLNMLSLRDSIYLQMTTFDATLPRANTQAQDESVGAALLSRARTYPESVNYGTGTCRVSIDAQAGKLSVATGYTSGWVSPVLDVLTKNCLYYSGTYVSGTPKGRPNNEVTIFNQMSWTAATATQKQLNWDTGLNAVSYADEDVLFYPDRRTVFADDTALLSSETFCHYIVFVKKIVRVIWTYYVGREESPSDLADDISKDIDSEINRVFKSRITSSTSVTQTELDKLNGFSYTVTVALTGNMPDRIWNVVIPVTRSVDVASAS